MKPSWPTKKLGEICEERKERNTKKLNLPVYSISNVLGFVLSEEYFYKRVYSENLKNYKLVYKYDFAYNPARVNVGSIGIYKGDTLCLISPMYEIFYIRDIKTLNPYFLFYLLKTDLYQNIIKNLAASQGSIRQVLKLRDLFDLEIPVPPLDIQQKIVKILDTIQEAVDVQEKIIEKTKELKKSLMADLFKYGAPSFRKGRKLKKTEIGEIPENWEVVRLGEVYKITNKPPALNFKNFGLIPFIPMEEIGFGTINPKYYMKSSDEISSGVYFEKGDLLLAKITPSFENGKQSIVENIPLNFGIATTEVIPIKQTHKSNIYYLFYLLQKTNVRESLAESMEGTTGRRRLSKNALLNFLIPLPSFPEQQEIVKILQTVDQKIEIEQKKKELYEELFKTMLNKIMAQEIDVEEIEV